MTMRASAVFILAAHFSFGVRVVYPATYPLCCSRIVSLSIMLLRSTCRGTIKLQVTYVVSYAPF